MPLSLVALGGAAVLLHVGKGRGQDLILALGAIVGGALAIAVDAVAYGKVNDTINGLSGYAIGYGLYLGIAAGVVGALGGAMALRARR